MKNTDSKNVDILEFILHIDTKVLMHDSKELVDLLLNRNTILFRTEENAKNIKIFLHNIAVFQTVEKLNIAKLNKSKALRFLRKLNTVEINELVSILAVFTAYENKSEFSQIVGEHIDHAKIKVKI